MGHEMGNKLLVTVHCSWVFSHVHVPQAWAGALRRALQRERCSAKHGSEGLE